jgi:predicted nucleotidyltransferase
VDQVVRNLETIASELARVGISDVVFVGGAVVGLLLTDEAAAEPRVTVDVDLVVNVTSRKDYYEVEARLREAGFDQPPEGPICRWVVRGIPVDVMPVEESVLGFSNRWYAELFESSQAYRLASGQEIRITSAPYLLATKIEAFKSRGADDFLMSSDINGRNYPR